MARATDKPAHQQWYQQLKEDHGTWFPAFRAFTSSLHAKETSRMKEMGRLEGRVAGTGCKGGKRGRRERGREGEGRGERVEREAWKERGRREIKRDGNGVKRNVRSREPCIEECGRLEGERETWSRGRGVEGGNGVETWSREEHVSKEEESDKVCMCVFVCVCVCVCVCLSVEGIAGRIARGNDCRERLQIAGTIWERSTRWRKRKGRMIGGQRS